MTTLVSVANGGVGLVVPADWETTLDAAPGIPVVAVAPPTPTPFRTNVVVTVGDVQVLVVDPTRVPALLAKVVRLGPRPRLTPGALRCPFVVVAGLTAPDAGQRAASVDRLAGTCPTEWTEWAEQLRGGRWRMWSTRTTWPATNMTPTGRAVTVLDTPAGVVRVDEPQVDVADATDQTSLTATTPTEIWLELTRLLPTDADLPPLG